VAVLAGVDAPTARRLASLSRLADPAIAFVPKSVAHAEGVDALRSAGWIVGLVDPARAVPDLWNDTVLVERGSTAGVA
jgi:hypothetical protein